MLLLNRLAEALLNTSNAKRASDLMRRKPATEKMTQEAIDAVLCEWSEFDETHYMGKDRWFVHQVQVRTHMLFDVYDCQDGPSDGFSSSRKNILKLVGLPFDKSWVNLTVGDIADRKN